MVCGYLGAGKTTFARELAESTGALVISEDRWYLGLFADGKPTAHLDDVLLARLVAVLDELWPNLLRHGVDVVLDFGFWSRARRARSRRLAHDAGAETRMYLVRCDDEVARARVAARDRNPRDSFLIGPAAYDALRTKFEDPGSDEDYEVIETSSGGELYAR